MFLTDKMLCIIDFEVINMNYVDYETELREALYAANEALNLA